MKIYPLIYTVIFKVNSETEAKDLGKKIEEISNLPSFQALKIRQESPASN